MKKAIVIGGGLGGISAAASLAAEGFAVDLFEKNDHLGGKLNVLEKEGFSFDLGPSILTMPHLFERLFTRVGRRLKDYVDIVALEPHWRNFFEDGTCIDLYAAPDETVERNTCLGEDDRRQLKSFMEYSRGLYDSAVPSYFDRGIDTFWGMLRYHGLLRAIKTFDAFATVNRGVRRHVKNPYLVDILNFFIKYVGSSPYRAPALLNLLPYVQSEFGLWYVPGGLFRLAQALARLLADIGVAVATRTEVRSLVVEGGRVTGARLADGTVRNGDVFISNMEVVPAYRNLLGERASFLRRFRRFEPSCSGLVLHLGVDREYPQLGHHNFFFSKHPRKHFRSVFRDHVLPHDPTIYLVAPARTDRTQAPVGCENLKILPHIPYVQDPPFGEEDYRALKDRVLDKLERMGLEDLRKHIVVEDMWVPEDIQKRYYSNRGAIYGVVSDWRKNFGLKAPKKSDKYVNLYFVGGSVNPGAGMPMAVLSGQQVRDRVLEDGIRGSS